MTLYLFVGIIALVCILGFFNEKVTKLTYEIALMLFAIVIGILIILATTVFKGAEVLEQAQMMDIEDFLLKGVLCFMLFAGSFRMALSDFKKMARQITVLAFVCTLLGSIFYGLLFYGAALLLGVNLSLPVCLMFGSIVAPTDPIAATGKYLLPHPGRIAVQRRRGRRAVCLLLQHGDLFRIGQLFRRHAQRGLWRCRGRHSGYGSVLLDVPLLKEQNASHFHQPARCFALLRDL